MEMKRNFFFIFSFPLISDAWSTCRFFYIEIQEWAQQLDDDDKIRIIKFSAAGIFFYLFFINCPFIFLYILFNLFNVYFLLDCFINFWHFFNENFNFIIFVNNCLDYYSNYLYISPVEYYLFFTFFFFFIMMCNVFFYSFFCFFYFLSFTLDFLLLENWFFFEFHWKFDISNNLYILDSTKDFWMRFFYVEIDDILVIEPEKEDRMITSYFGTTFEHFIITFKYTFKKIINSLEFFFSNLTNSNLKVFSYKKTVFPLSLKVIRPEVLTLWNRKGFSLAPTYTLPFVYLPKGEIFQQNRALLKTYITSTRNHLNYSWLNQGGWTYIPFVHAEKADYFLYRTGFPEGWRFFLTEYVFIIKTLFFVYLLYIMYEFYRIPSGEYTFDPDSESANPNYDIQTSIESIYPLAQKNASIEDIHEKPDMQKDEVLKKFYNIDDIEWLKQSFVGRFALEHDNLFDNYPGFLDWIKFRVFSILMPIYRIILLYLPSFVKNILFFEDLSDLSKKIFMFFMYIPVGCFLLLKYFVNNILFRVKYYHQILLFLKIFFYLFIFMFFFWFFFT